MTIPGCPECGSPAIAARLIFKPTGGQDGLGGFTYAGKICKSCDHAWWPEEEDPS